METRRKKISKMKNEVKEMKVDEGCKGKEKIWTKAKKIERWRYQLKATR